MTQPAEPNVADPVEDQIFVILAWRNLICARLSQGIVPNLSPRDSAAAEALWLRTRTEGIIAPDYLSALDAVLCRVDAAIEAGKIPARQVEAPDGSGLTWERSSRTAASEALMAAVLDIREFRGALRRLHDLLAARRLAAGLRGAA